MSDSNSDFVIQYPFSSKLSLLENKEKLELAIAKNARANPYMFEGSLNSPAIAAALLLLLPRLASTRFYTPPNMLAAILAAADPVITCSRDAIRLESFSACGSAYARMDINSDACEGEFVGKGTTNVDFHQDLRDALAGLSARGKLDFGVGKAEAKISVDNQIFIERKVQLPARWVRGFAEVSAYQEKMILIYDVPKIPATRFLQTLPGISNEKADYYIVLRSGQLMLSQQKQSGTVKVAGLTRLRLLKSLAPWIDRLRIYGDPAGHASSWLISAGPYNLEFTISSAVHRGFSGEGQLLNNLARAEPEHYINRLKAALNWQTQISTSELATQCDTTDDVIKGCLSRLGSAGLVGFDCSTSSYFHRELPFKSDAQEKLNPRLRSAKKLLEEDGIHILHAEPALVEARIIGSGVSHTVRQTPDGFTCTCVWHAKHQLSRGPCKHMLSLQMFMENAGGE